MIKILKTKEELVEYKSVWDSIYNSDSNATPFQKFDFIFASIDLTVTGSQQLYVLLVKDDSINKWLAAFPLVIDKKGILHFINSAHSDFCSPIVCDEFNNYNLYDEVASFIKGEEKIKGLKLDNIGTSNQMLAVMKPHFKFMIAYDMNYYSSIPIYKLDSDKDSIDAFRYVKSKRHKKLRKSIKEVQNCKFVIARKSEGVPYPEADVQYLVNKMLSDGIRVKEYFSSAMLSFWKMLYESNVVCMAMLYEGNEIRTCNFMFYDEKRNEYIKWLMLYKEGRWNMIINIMIADYLYQNGGGNINFARGIYDYKLENFHPDVKPLFCLRIAKTPFGHIKNMCAAAIHYAKPIVKQIIRR